jgi:peroxiredoxin
VDPVLASEVDDSAARLSIDFELQDTHGRRHKLNDVDERYLVLAFLGTECPLAKLYAKRLNDVAREFEPQGVRFFGINSNCQDSNTELVAYARRHELAFPLLKDLSNRLADQLDAVRTPEVFVLDEHRIVRYRGRIDDQYGVGTARARPTREDLRIALGELTHARPVTIPVTTAVGCHIGRLPRTATSHDVTYCQQVARILDEHCVECHRTGEIAPFALTSYEEVIGWGETIKEVIDQKRMPPWHASSEYGRFLNTRAIPEEQKRTIFQWVDAGMPEGDPRDLPAPRTYVSGWRLPRKPDRVIEMRDEPFAVPAEGIVEYQYFVVDPGFEEDQWVTAAEVVPGNRAVVHHAIAFIRPPGGERQAGIGWLSAYVPGQRLTAFPEHTARRIPAKSKLVFQIHYTPIGSVETDITRVGLNFTTADKVTTEVQTRIVLDRDFEIPPHASAYSVSMSADDFPPGSSLLAVAPHMHLRGSSFQIRAVTANTSEILLNVPKYDFNWQHAYLFEEKLPLEGTRIECVATFDNSADNLVNPDPSAQVHWGDQTWEEMAMAYLELAVPRVSRAEVSRDKTSQARRIISERNRNPAADKLSLEARSQALTEEYFRKLDTNQDRVITLQEAPLSYRVFAFKGLDTNQDKKLSWDEVLAEAKRTLSQP